MREDKNGHTQAQPPRYVCANCGHAYFTAARPAEQPAPPRTIETGTGMGSMEEPVCKHDSPNCQHEQPSAPPQPARKRTRSHADWEQEALADPVIAKGYAEARAAEPSVEARQVLAKILNQPFTVREQIVANALTAVKREGMEEAARLVDEKAWTLLDIGDLAASAEMKLMAAILRLPKEQQNGTR